MTGRILIGTPICAPAAHPLGHITGATRHDGSVRTLMSAYVGLVAAVALTACTGNSSTPAPSIPPTIGQSPINQPIVVTDLESFVNGLELGGHEVRIERHEAGENDIFGVRGHNVSFEGARVMAFEYRSDRAAQRLQQSVNKEGDMIGSWHIDWGGQHLYRAGALIVVYLGERNGAIRTLEDLLGTQFAPRS